MDKQSCLPHSVDGERHAAYPHLGQSGTEEWNLGCSCFLRGQILFRCIRNCSYYLASKSPLMLSDSVPTRKQPTPSVALIFGPVPLCLSNKTTTEAEYLAETLTRELPYSLALDWELECQIKHHLLSQAPPINHLRATSCLNTLSEESLQGMSGYQVVNEARMLKFC